MYNQQPESMFFGLSEIATQFPSFTSQSMEIALCCKQKWDNDSIPAPVSLQVPMSSLLQKSFADEGFAVRTTGRLADDDDATRAHKCR